MKTLYKIFTICFSLMSIGCDDGSIKLTIKDLEEQSGLIFSSNTVLLNSDDGGGRDPNYGFYTWTLFSPSEITMPIRETSISEDGYLDRCLDVSVRYLESSMGKQKRKILNPQRAFSSNWLSNNYEFRGSIVRTPQGDYMVVQRFRTKK